MLSSLSSTQRDIVTGALILGPLVGLAHTAAKRVLADYNFTSTLTVERIWREADEYDFEHRVIDDAHRFICTSLPDVIGAFVKHRMGDRYQHLFDERMFLWGGATVE